MTADYFSKTTFASVDIDIAGAAATLTGREGQPASVSGTLEAPGQNLVLWRLVEQVEIEQAVTDRELIPHPSGSSATYRYAVSGGKGGLLHRTEPGHFKAKLTAAFAPASFLGRVGEVEIISTHLDKDAVRGTEAQVSRQTAFSPEQAQGRLVRSNDNAEDDTSTGQPSVYLIEDHKKRLLESPTVGRLRFGEDWQRLIQTLPSNAVLTAIPDGLPLTLPEVAEGRLLGAWPALEAYFVQNRKKRLIANDEPVAGRFGPHWRIQLVHLRADEIAGIPDGHPIDGGAPL